MRRFVVVGHKATTTPDFSLKDIPGTSGRIDVLLRCVRSALLVSHGLRQDTHLYLVLLGGLESPKTVRLRGEGLRNVNPDERSTATIVQKALGTPTTGPVWQPATPGMDVGAMALADLEADLGVAAAPGGEPRTGVYVLDENGTDIRDLPLAERDLVFVVGDHLGFTRDDQAVLARWGARKVSVGPVSLHAEDAISLVQNELDRRKL